MRPLAELCGIHYRVASDTCGAAYQMANWISNSRNPNSTDVDMSNGATDAIIAVLCLAGADIATSSWERCVMTWIAAHDQSILGRGCAFFDIADLGWTTADFAIQHAFILSVLDRALAHQGWDKLPYSPNAAIVDGMLSRIRQLVTEFTIEYCDDATLEWPTDPPESDSRCDTHGVFMHAHGCPICNDMP